MARSRGVTEVSGIETISGPVFETGSWTISPVVVAGGGSVNLENVENNFYMKLGQMVIAFTDFWVTFTSPDSNTYIDIDAPFTVPNANQISGFGVYTQSTTTSYGLILAPDVGQKINIYMNEYRDDSFTSTFQRFIRGSVIYRTTD